MARKKKVYYELLNALKENGIDNTEAKKRADVVYDVWFNNVVSEDIFVLYNMVGGVDDHSKFFKKENGEQVLIFNDENHHDLQPQYKNPLTDIDPNFDWGKHSKENILSEINSLISQEVNIYSKLDWEKYLKENPHFLCLDRKKAVQWGKIKHEHITKKEEREVLENCDDELKIILLKFFKDLAHLQGFMSIRYNPIGQSHEGYCCLECVIEWNNGQTTSGIGDAHINNSSGFSKYYCGPIAENRSFIRAVKAFFNIGIVGDIEIGDTPSEKEETNSSSNSDEEAPTSPAVTLKKRAQTKLKDVNSFEDFLKFLRSQYKKADKSKGTIKPWISQDEAESWKDYGDWVDIPKSKIIQLIGEIDNFKDVE